MLVKYIYMYSNKCNNPNKYLFTLYCNILFTINYIIFKTKYKSTHIIKIESSSFYFLKISLCCNKWRPKIIYDNEIQICM